MKIAILAFLIVFALVGQAVCRDGNELLSKCKATLKTTTDPKDIPDANFCLGFIVGVADTSITYHGLYNAPHLVCIPADAKIPHTQLATVVVKYLENHPDQLHYEASSTVIAALREVFPCK